MEPMVLIEDPQAATLGYIIAEVAAKAPAMARKPEPKAGSRAVHVEAYASPQGTSYISVQSAAALAGPQWISPAPVAVKMRLFCLPYAGGVSENVFGRYERPCCAHWNSDWV